jgi:hypothetical protein
MGDEVGPPPAQLAHDLRGGIDASGRGDHGIGPKLPLRWPSRPPMWVQRYWHIGGFPVQLFPAGHTHCL